MRCLYMIEWKVLSPFFFISWLLLLVTSHAEATRKFVISHTQPTATKNAAHREASIGAVIIDDYKQQLAADLLFQEGWVFINMNIEDDGITLNFTVNTQGQSITISPSCLTSSASNSPLQAAIKAGTGSPSLWFSQSDNNSYRFILPKIEHPTDLSGQVPYQFGGVRAFPFRPIPQWFTLAFRLDDLFMPLGFSCQNHPLEVLASVTDSFIYQLIELLTTAFIAEQLTKGAYFTRREQQQELQYRPYTRLTWRSDTKHCWYPGAHPVAQGYMMWTSDDGDQWDDCEYYSTPPEQYYDNPEGFSSTTTTIEGKELKCFQQPVLSHPKTNFHPKFDNLQDQLKHMQANPPAHCRGGEKKPAMGGMISTAVMAMAEPGLDIALAPVNCLTETEDETQP